MKYKEYLPGPALKRYVKCYYILESDTDTVFEDKAYATGCIEVMFNLGAGSWQTATGSGFETTPRIELWGQIIRPLSFRSAGKFIMLGIRFYPHTASVILDEDISLFNNRVTDLMKATDRVTKDLYSRLLNTPSLEERFQLIEEFLLHRLSRSGKKLEKIILVSKVMEEMTRDSFFDNIGNVASGYGITSRYLQKIFLQTTGLTPKLFMKINRFQQSLRLVAKNRDLSLTSIAYECGYFDQSHFIRDFKSFTGFTPSVYDPIGSSASLVLPDN